MRRRLAAFAGVAVLAIGLVVAISGASGTYEVRAVFDDVRGLIEGGEVKAGSENIGSVSDVTLGEDGLPVVTMEVDDDYILHQGAFANIRLASNVGGVNRYVDLSSGDESLPRLPDGAMLGPGQTDQPVDLDIAVSDLDPKTREDIAAVIAGLEETFRGRGDDLERALRHSGQALRETSLLLDAVSHDRRALKMLVADGATVAGALAEGPADLQGAADRTAALLAATASRQEELGRTARSLGPGLRGAREAFDLLRDGIPSLTDLAVASGPAIREISPTAAEVAPVVAALEPMLVEARRLIAASPAQVRLFKRVREAVTPVIARLDPLLEGTGPFVDYLRAYAPEAVNFFSLWGDASSNFDAAGNVSRLGFHPMLAEDHTNPIGPTDGPIPGRLVPPFARVPGANAGAEDAWTDYWKSFIGGGKPFDELVEP